MRPAEEGSRKTYTTVVHPCTDADYRLGVVSVLPVIETPIAAEIGTSLPAIFAGTSVMFVAIGLAAPWVGRAFRRFGTRQVMAAGTGLIGCSLCLPASPLTYRYSGSLGH